MMNNINVTSGIKPQRTTSPQAATNPYNTMRPPQGGTIGMLYNQFAPRQQIQDQRNMASANANYGLNSQIQRSNSGLQWGQLGNQMQMENVQNQAANRNLGTSLLSQILGGY